MGIQQAMARPFLKPFEFPSEIHVNIYSFLFHDFQLCITDGIVNLQRSKAP
jgi:hypothetical protein